MKFFATAAALVALVPAVLGLTVNTPTGVVSCQPIQFTWADGAPPYFLSLIPGGQPSAAAIQSFPTQQGTSFSWSQVTLPANTQFTVALKDSSGTQAFSDIVTVQDGGDTSCLNGSTSVVAGGSSTSGSSPATSASSGSSASSTSAGSGSSSSHSGSATSSSPSSTSSSSASRGSSVGAFGVAGVMGLVGAALF